MRNIQSKLKTARKLIAKVKNGEGWFSYMRFPDCKSINVDHRLFSMFEKHIPDVMDIANGLMSSYLSETEGYTIAENPAQGEMFYKVKGRTGTATVYFAIVDGELYASCEQFCDF